MTQLGFVFDANVCTGCKACVVACKDVKNLPVGYKYRRVVTGEAGSWQVDAASGIPQPVGVFSYSLSYSCMHCTQPACMAACPQKAISKDVTTGIVTVDESLCVGCGNCAVACPWKAPVVIPAIDGKRKMGKCDFCKDLLAAGEEPACVAACAMRCLHVAEFPEDQQAVGFQDPLLPDASWLGPNMVLEAHRCLKANPHAQVRLHSMPEEYANE